MGWMRHLVCFYTEFNGFELRFFLLLDRLPYQSFSPVLLTIYPKVKGEILDTFTKDCEIRLVLSRIWTRVAVSISYHGIHFTTNDSEKDIMS